MEMNVAGEDISLFSSNSDLSLPLFGTSSPDLACMGLGPSLHTTADLSAYASAAAAAAASFRAFDAADPARLAGSPLPPPPRLPPGGVDTLPPNNDVSRARSRHRNAPAGVPRLGMGGNPLLFDGGVNHGPAAAAGTPLSFAFQHHPMLDLGDSNSSLLSSSSSSSSTSSSSGSSSSEGGSSMFGLGLGGGGRAADGTDGASGGVWDHLAHPSLRTLPFRDSLPDMLGLLLTPPTVGEIMVDTLPLDGSATSSSSSASSAMQSTASGNDAANASHDANMMAQLSLTAPFPLYSRQPAGVAGGSSASDGASNGNGGSGGSGDFSFGGMLTTSATGGPGGCSSFCGPVGFSGDVVGSTAVGKQSGGNTEDEDRDYESIKGLLRWDSDPDLKEMPNTPTFGASASAPSISAEDAAAAASLHQGILSTLRELQLPTDGLHSPSLQLPQSLAAPGAAESLIMNDDFMQGVSELHFGPGGLSDPTGLDHGYLLRAVDPRNQYRSSHHPNHSLDHHNQQQQHHHHHNHGNRNPHQTELISTLSADAAVLSDSLDTTRLTSSTLRQDFLCPTVGNDSGGDSVGNGSSGGGPPSGDSIAGHGHQGHLMSASAAAASASYPGTAINPQRAIGGSMGWDTNMLTELRTGFPAQSAAMVRPPGTGAAAAVTSSASSGRPRRMSRQSSSVQRLTSVSAAISRQNSPMIAGVGFGGIGGAKASAGSGASRGSSKRGNNQNVSGEPYPTLGSSKSLSKRVPQGLAGVSSCSSSGTSTAASVRSGSGADRSNKIIEMEDLIRQNTALRIQVAEAQAEREREEAESGKMLETLQLLMSMRR